MSKKSRKRIVIISIYQGIPEVEKLPKGILVKIRDFDLTEIVEGRTKYTKDMKPYEEWIFEA